MILLLAACVWPTATPPGRVPVPAVGDACEPQPNLAWTGSACVGEALEPACSRVGGAEWLECPRWEPFAEWARCGPQASTIHIVRCEPAGHLAFRELPEGLETTWFDGSGRLVAVRSTTFLGVPSCCSGVEVWTVTWGDPFACAELPPAATAWSCPPDDSG